MTRPARKRRRPARARPTPSPSARRELLDRLTWLLLIASASSLLALALVGPLELAWEPLTLALLYHGAIDSAVLACALGWRSDQSDLRWTPRVFVLAALATWAHTWSPWLQEATAWLARLRYLWLEV
jgi:hypothetical protein